MANFFEDKFKSMKEAYAQWHSPKQEGSVSKTPEATTVAKKPELAEKNREQSAETRIENLGGKVADISIATENQLDAAMEATSGPEAKQKIAELKEQAIAAAEHTFYKISERLGSNRGGWYEDTGTKEKYYVKFYENFDQARVEYIANAIYAKLGINAVKSEFKTVNGEQAVASSEIPGAKAVNKDEVKQSADVRSGFVADAYLANWDVTGASYDNIVQGEDEKMYRIDNGGSLTFRARGGQKKYPPDVMPELQNMVNPDYPSGKIFDDITEKEMRQQAELLINNLSEADIDTIVQESGCAEELAETLRIGLKGRRQFLMKRFDIQPTQEKNKAGLLPSQIESARNPRTNIKEILEQDAKIDMVFDNPKTHSYMSVNYQLPDYYGRELKLGHRLAFVIPEEFRNRIVRDVILKHRKDEKYRVNIGADGWDPHGAYSRVELHNNETGQWQQWKDPKGHKTDKFAEPRPASNPENEVLHDWVAMVGELKPDAVRITNVGQHEEYSTAQIHGVEVIFFPETKNVHYREHIYCKGTEFIDIEKGKTLPKYGGGSHTEGKYIGAIALNQSREALYELNKTAGSDAELRDGKLFIKLEPGKSLVQLEVAMGDTEHLKEVNPKTNRHTRLGYAKLWAGIKRAGSGNIEWFMENMNIPPQGVFAGGPLPEQSAIQEGDELVIEARADTAYLMGFRLAYKDTENVNTYKPTKAAK